MKLVLGVFVLVLVLGSYFGQVNMLSSALLSYYWHMRDQKIECDQSYDGSHFITEI